MARENMKRETGVVLFDLLPTRVIALGVIALSISTAVASTARADGFPYRIPGETDVESVDTARGGSDRASNPTSRAQLASNVSSNSDTGAAVASNERREAARAHYERARTMLLESLAEFEAARGIARPDRIMDSEQWRSNVLSRVSELERVIDPAPRVVESAVVTREEPTLLREEASGGHSAGVHAKLAISSAHAESSKAKVTALPKSKSIAKAEPKAAPEKKTAAVHEEKSEKIAKLSPKVEPAKADKLAERQADALEAERAARQADQMIPPPVVEKKDVANADKAKDDVIDALVSESEKSADTAKAEPVVAAKADDHRIDPLTEEEIKVRLKKLAADIEARDSSADAGSSAGGQLAVDPTAKN